jgi:hypothetical protein
MTNNSEMEVSLGDLEILGAQVIWRLSRYEGVSACSHNLKASTRSDADDLSRTEKEGSIQVPLVLSTSTTRLRAVNSCH